MATLSELMMKVVDGNPLAPLERENLRQMLNEVDNNRIITSTWQRVQDKKINTDYFDLPFVPIASQVLEQDMDSVTVEIPSIYNHLFVIVSGRTTGIVGTGDYVRCQFNGDTTATNYAYQSVGATGGTVGNLSDTSDPSLILGSIPTSNADANASGFTFGIISHLQDINRWKSTMGIGGQWHTAAAGMSIFLVYGTWKSQNAIQTIKLVPDSSFITSTIVSVFGIK